MKTKLLLLLTVLSLNIALAQEFIENGIKYSITSGTTVEVIANDPVYSGDIAIPATATDATTTYNVTAIGEEKHFIHVLV